MPTLVETVREIQENVEWSLAHRFHRLCGAVIASIEQSETVMRLMEGSDEPKSDEWPSLATIKERYVAKVLAFTKGNKQATARILGIDRKTLDRAYLGK